MGIIRLEVDGARLMKNSHFGTLNWKLFRSSLHWKSSNKDALWPNKLNNRRLIHQSAKALSSTHGKEKQRQNPSSISSRPTFMTNSDLWYDYNNLESLQRRDLQKLCKKYSIRAISKTEKLIEDLKTFHKQNLSNPSSILHSPFIPGSISSVSGYKRPEMSSNKEVDKSSGIFASLDVSSSSVRRDDELQRMCKAVGARTTSSRSTASTLDSLKTNLGELDKTFKILADTCNEDEIFLEKKPSVSTILNLGGNQNKAFIISKWRKKKIEEMGEEPFKKYQKDIIQRGKTFHSYIKGVFSGTHSSIDSNQGCVESVVDVLKDISCVIATEKRVSHYHLGYSGFLDMLALYKGIPCLIEWKTSEKPKASLTDCHDFPLQVAAYAGAINSSPYFSVPVTNGLVVIAYHDGTPAHVHKMDMQTCDYYWQQWLIRVYKYKQILENQK